MHSDAAAGGGEPLDGASPYPLSGNGILYVKKSSSGPGTSARLSKRTQAPGARRGLLR
nr:MAG TPA: hypothetical protein [Caudoviricetes sp.]